MTGESVRFSFKTIERWWYTARGVDDPISALARKVPSHAGTHPSVGPALAEAIAKQHRDHPRWTFQLHYDNVLALAREDPRLGPLPSCVTVCRFYERSRGSCEPANDDIASRPMASRSRRARRVTR